MIMAECNGPGDYLSAMKRVAERFSLQYGLFCDLRYRKPKSLGIEDYFALFQAYIETRNAAEAKTRIGTMLLGVADKIRETPRTEAARP
jgi:hypothetical protein